MELNEAEVFFDEFMDDNAIEASDDFVEDVLNDVLSFDDEGITLHGPNECLELASPEDCSRRELRAYFSLLRENLGDMLENVIASVENTYEEFEEEPKEPKGETIMNSDWQAIELIEGETVAEFLEQFEHIQKTRTIPWSAWIDVLRDGEVSPHDGRRHAHLPLPRSVQETQQ
jgi:hypothetical protein